VRDFGCWQPSSQLCRSDPGVSAAASGGQRAHRLLKSPNNPSRICTLADAARAIRKIDFAGPARRGAAHEINNPLTAILDIRICSPTTRRCQKKADDCRPRSRPGAPDQNSCWNLLSFARQVPPETRFAGFEHGREQRVNCAPWICARNDQSGNGSWNRTARSARRRKSADAGFLQHCQQRGHAMESAHGGEHSPSKPCAIVPQSLFSFDSGPGIKEPHSRLDPFYTTKPVGKGTGLGLSICFGIIQERAGRILCYNRQEGGPCSAWNCLPCFAVLPLAKATERREFRAKILLSFSRFPFTEEIQRNNLAVLESC